MRPLTLSPISGDISEPNCCSVVRNLFNLLSCRAPHVGGSWLPLAILGERDLLGLDGWPFTTLGLIAVTGLPSWATGPLLGGWLLTGDDTIDDNDEFGTDSDTELAAGESGILTSRLSKNRM